MINRKVTIAQEQTFLCCCIFIAKIPFVRIFQLLIAWPRSSPQIDQDCWKYNEQRTQIF